MNKAPETLTRVEDLEQSDILPEGWSVASLGDVSTARLGKTPSKNDYSDTGQHRIVKFRDLTSKGLNYSITKAGYVKNSSDALRGLRRLSIGDVLVTASAHSGDQIGKKCAYVREMPEARDGVYFVGELLAVTSDTRVMHKKWPYLWFLSEAGMETVQAAVAGVHLTAGRAQGIPIPIPPFEEQRRIIVSSDALLAKVEVVRDHFSKLTIILKAFRQSVLAAACSGRLTEDWRARASHSELSESELPPDWRAGELAELCVSIADGDHQPPPKQSNGIPFLVIGNISSGALEFGETRFVSESYFKRIKSERIPRRGDVLYTVVGASIGIPVVVDTDRPFCFQRHIAILKPASTTTTGYLRLVMQSRDLYRQAWEGVTGSAQPTLPLGNLRRLAVLIPPIEEQNEIVRRVEALFRLADKIEERTEAATKRADKLTQSILAKAFRGELVPTEAELARKEGRDYEPASALLERIKSEREKSAASTNDIKRRKIVVGKK
jgi:type I restriction enzyme S subunit